MAVITRTITNNLSTNLDLFVPGYNTIKPQVVIAPSATVDLFTVLTGDELEAIQNQLTLLAANSSITVNATVNTNTFNPVGGAAGITALTGDVTASGTGSVVATIASGHVTPAKISITSTDDFTFPRDVTVARNLTVSPSLSSNCNVVFGNATTPVTTMKLESQAAAQTLLIFNANGDKWGLINNTDGTFLLYDFANNVAVATLYPHGGIAPTNLTTTQKNALNNDPGKLVFDTTLAKLCVNNGTGWETVTSA